MGLTVEKVAPEVLADMAEDIRNGFVAVHPGEIFRRRVLAGSDLTVQTAADRMGVSRQMLHRVLSGQSSVTAEMAIRMAELSGSRPETWLQLQNQFDLAQVVRGSSKSGEADLSVRTMPEGAKGAS